MSVPSPLQNPPGGEESLANGLMQDPGGSAVTVALGVSGNKPCGETREETALEEAVEATSVCVATNSTSVTTTTTNSGPNNTSMPPQPSAQVNWSAEEDHFLTNFQLSVNKDESSEGRVSLRSEYC